MRRAREIEEDVQVIHRALRRNPGGLTRKQLTELTGLSWETLRKLAARDPMIVRVVTGKNKSRYSLKGNNDENAQ